MDETADELLVAEALAGDGRAFAQLVARYQDRAYGVAVGMLSDFDLARDVVQEAFLRAYRDLRKLKDPTRFGGWLRGIVRHTAHGALRELARVRSLAQELGPSAEQIEPPPDRRAEEAERRRIVRQALARLNEKNREAVSLYYVDGLSYADIAAFLGVTETTVRGRLHRGRGQLRKEFTMVARAFEDEHLPEDFPAEIRRLLDELAAGREQAEHTVRLLADIGGEAVDPLCQAMGDPRDVVREVAARALCRIGDPRALRPILQVLYTGDWRIGNAILRTGRALEVPGVREEMLRLVGEGTPEQQYWAIEALANAHDDDEVHGCLLGLFRTPGSRWRAHALTALCKLRPAEAVPLVSEALADPDIRPKSGWAWWIAVRDGYRIPIETCLGGLDRDVAAISRVMAGRLVLRHGQPGRKVMDELMQAGPPARRAAAAVALADKDDPRPFDVLIGELLEGYRERKWARVVARALVRAYGDRLLAWAEENQPGLADRPTLAWALGKARIAAGSAAAEDVLHYGGPAVRAEAVKALARRKGADFLPELRACLREGRPKKVARAAFRQMLRLGDAALATVEKMRASEHWTERKAAVCLLRRWGRLTGQHAAEAERDPHVAVRHAVTRRPPRGRGG